LDNALSPSLVRLGQAAPKACIDNLSGLAAPCVGLDEQEKWAASAALYIHNVDFDQTGTLSPRALVGNQAMVSKV
jgi:hypothetical protein